MEGNDMQRFKDILCVVAPGSEGGAALERAANLAGNNQARLTVVCVIDKIPPDTTLLERVFSPEDLQAKFVEEHRQGLEELVTQWRSDVGIQIKVLSGIPFLSIISEVLRNDRDLVIKTAEHGGLLDRVFGSDDMHLLRKCPCPVWLLKPESPKSYRRILAAVDVDDGYPPKELKTRHALNRAVLEMASSLALSEFAELHIVNTWEAFGESAMRSAFMKRPEDEIVAYVEEVKQKYQKHLSELVDGVIGKLGRETLEHIKPQTRLVKGSPRKELPVLARDIEADLVVMGTVARTGIPGFIMGNTAETILNRLDCSVLAIKPPGFETPVTLED